MPLCAGVEHKHSDRNVARRQRPIPSVAQQDPEGRNPTARKRSSAVKSNDCLARCRTHHETSGPVEGANRDVRAAGCRKTIQSSMIPSRTFRTARPSPARSPMRHAPDRRVAFGPPVVVRSWGPGHWPSSLRLRNARAAPHVRQRCDEVQAPLGQSSRRPDARGKYPFTRCNRARAGSADRLRRTTDRPGLREPRCCA